MRKINHAIPKKRKRNLKKPRENTSYLPRESKQPECKKPALDEL